MLFKNGLRFVTVRNLAVLVRRLTTVSTVCSGDGTQQNHRAGKQTR
jgi:hypothetical protein